MKRQIDEELLLTSIQLQHRLDITAMTIHYWRQPAEDRPAIPHLVKKNGNKNAVFFPISEVEQWLNLYKPNKKGMVREDTCDCWHCKRRRRASDATSGRAAGINAPVEVV